jgi:cobalt-zinc-cadmium efflux system protein
MHEKQEHHHDHQHHGPVVLTHLNTAFIVGMALNFLFVVAEVAVGLYIHSLSLLSDAGHNLADVGALGLSLLAFRLQKVKSNERYTYGYRKTSILVALFNAVVLLVSIGAIIYEAIHRFISPEPVQGSPIAIVAAIGIVINAGTALLFFREKEKDLNVKSAYLHLLSDAIVSVGIVAAGICISYTGWSWIDPVTSIVIALVIIAGTWKLLKQSLRLSLDGVPEGIRLDEIRNAVLKVNGVKDFKHVHIWAISTTENALTGHLVILPSAAREEELKIKQEVKHLLEHMNVQHVTLETIC